MRVEEGGAELLTTAAQAKAGQYAQHGKGLFAGGWLMLKPPYGLDDYAYTISNDELWFDRKGIRRIMRCRLGGIEHDLESVLRRAANEVKGLTQEERQHCLDAADRWAQNKASRAQRRAQTPVSEGERLLQIVAQGNKQLAENLIEAVKSIVQQPAESSEEQPTRGRRREGAT